MFGHSIALTIDAFRSFGSWPSFSATYTRCLNQSYVLILLYVTHGLITSIREKPLCLMPRTRTSARVFVSPENPRATNVAPAAIARASGLIGLSITPSGVLLVLCC